MSQLYSDLPGSAVLAYAELLDQALSSETTDRTGFAFNTKTVKGRPYWYLQHVLGDVRKQYYLGEESAALLQRMEEQKARWAADKSDQTVLERLLASAVAAGCAPIIHRAYKVLSAVAQAGLFRAGGVLVGSYAFLAMGNMLGVSWRRDTTITQDIDIAGSPECMVAVPQDARPLRDTILASEDTLLEVPMLNPSAPSTSFKIRGGNFRIDLVTPIHGKDSGPQHVAPIKSYAQPLRFLDYLLEDTQKAVLLHKAGVLVNIPNPARYALHKLVVAQRRPAAEAAKSRKDREQAAQVINYLLDQRPGDLWLALDAAKEYRNAKFIKQMTTGIKKLTNDLSAPLLGQL